MRYVVAALVALSAVGCGGAAPSPVAWGEFQSRVLDTQEEYRGKEITDAAFGKYLADQQAWAAGVTADPCYDPALRAYRAFLEDVAGAYTKIGGRQLADVPTEDLEAAKKSIEAAIDSDSRLTLAMATATDVCNR